MTARSCGEVAHLEQLEPLGGGFLCVVWWSGCCDEDGVLGKLFVKFPRARRPWLAAPRWVGQSGRLGAWAEAGPKAAVSSNLRDCGCNHRRRLRGYRDDVFGEKEDAVGVAVGRLECVRALRKVPCKRPHMYFASTSGSSPRQPTRPQLVPLIVLQAQSGTAVRLLLRSHRNRDRAVV